MWHQRLKHCILIVFRANFWRPLRPGSVVSQSAPRGAPWQAVGETGACLAGHTQTGRSSGLTDTEYCSLEERAQCALSSKYCLKASNKHLHILSHRGNKQTLIKTELIYTHSPGPLFTACSSTIRLGKWLLFTFAIKLAQQCQDFLFFIPGDYFKTIKNCNIFFSTSP